jgi:hypothetical protein
MLKDDSSPEAITKTRNTTTEEYRKTKQKKTSRIIYTNDGGNAVNDNATQPFRATGAGASAPKNYKTNDQYYYSRGYGHWAREWRKTYNDSKFGVGRGPVV